MAKKKEKGIFDFFSIFDQEGYIDNFLSIFSSLEFHFHTKLTDSQIKKLDSYGVGKESKNKAIGVFNKNSRNQFILDTSFENKELVITIQFQKRLEKENQVNKNYLVNESDYNFFKDFFSEKKKLRHIVVIYKQKADFLGQSYLGKIPLPVRLSNKENVDTIMAGVKLVIFYERKIKFDVVIESIISKDDPSKKGISIKIARRVPDNVTVAGFVKELKSHPKAIKEIMRL